ncbi:MAG: MFS transporter [Candidatus Pacebacteria bacterium]|jgi:DHA1 family tetracycline resistance protein-like MFS transporter|nr:MFS transporter [Candidatus Paceibacterota bacterium]
MNHKNPANASRKIVPLVFITILVDMLGIGVLIPIIPQLFTNPASPHYIASSAQYGSGYFLVGLLMALYSAGMFLAAPLFGELSDRYGRKKMLSYALGGGALSYALFALGIALQNIPLMLFSRIAGGLSAGNIGIAQAIIADITPPAQRAARFGLIGAAFGLGFILGPALGGILSNPQGLGIFGAATPFYFSALLASINVLWVIFVLPETNHNLKKASEKLSLLRSFSNISRALRPSTRRALFGVNFLFQAGFTFYTSFLGVLLVQRFGVGEVDIGTYFSYVGIFIVVTQGLITRPVTARFSEKQILRLSLPAVALAIVAIAFAPTMETLYFIAPFFAVATGLSMANLTSAVSRRAGEGVQGEVLGINSSVNALAQAFPPLLAGVVASFTAPVVPLFVAATFILLAAYGYRYVIHEHETVLR